MSTNPVGGYITRATSGLLNASKRGGALEVDHKWAVWLHIFGGLGGPQALKSGNRNQNFFIKYANSESARSCCGSSSKLNTDLGKARVSIWASAHGRAPMFSR